MESVNDICREEVIITDDILNEYTSEHHPLLRNSWPQVRCSVTINNDLIANQCRFRFAKNRPDEQMLNWWPLKMINAPACLNFIRTIILHYFINNRICFYVNFGFDMFLLPEGGEQRLLYASRSNYQALENAFLVYNESSLRRFLNILAHYDILNYINQTIAILNDDYEGDIQMISISMSFTRNLGKFY